MGGIAFYICTQGDVTQANNYAVYIAVHGKGGVQWNLVPAQPPQRGTTMRKLLALVALSVALITVGVVLGMAAEPAQPDCPTEDSCTIDYRDGRWYITPDIP